MECVCLVNVHVFVNPPNCWVPKTSPLTAFNKRSVCFTVSKGNLSGKSSSDGFLPFNGLDIQMHNSDPKECIIPIIENQLLGLLGGKKNVQPGSGG